MRERDPWKLLIGLPVLLALYVVILVTRTWFARVGYPYDLEWMEGGVLAHAWRVQHFKPIYVEPSAEFIPMVYTPGYYYVLAALGWVFGLSHGLARTVSILGSLGATTAILWFAHRRYHRPDLGVIGAGLFLAGYTHVGAFYDLARPDALAMGLLAWSLVLATEEEERFLDLSAGLLCAAFVVKHNTAAFGVPVALALWAWRGRPVALRWGLIAALPALLFTVHMEISTGGHFLGYVLSVPASHPIVWERVMPGMVREAGHAMEVGVGALAVWAMALGPRIAPRIPVPVHVVLPALGGAMSVWILGGMPEVFGIPRAGVAEATAGYLLLGAGSASVCITLIGMAISRKLHGPWLFGAGVLVTAGVTAALMRGHHGGFMNVVMPLHWTLVVAFVALLADTTDQIPGWRGLALTATLAFLQLESHIYEDLDLERYIPDEEDVAAGDRVTAYVEGREGPVLSAFAPWLPVPAGHEPGFHLIALWDINHKGGPYQKHVEAVKKAFDDHYWKTVVDAKESMAYGVARSYHQVKAFEPVGRALMPRSGWRRRPSVIWAPGAGPRLAEPEPEEQAEPEGAETDPPDAEQEP